MKRWILPILLLAVLVFAQDSTVVATAPIPPKVVGLVEAIILVIMMIVRGFSDPEWKTTFFNLTNIASFIGAINGIWIFIHPGGMTAQVQEMIVKVVMFVVPFLFVRRMSLKQRIGETLKVVFGRPQLPPQQ